MLWTAQFQTVKKGENQGKALFANRLDIRRHPTNNFISIIIVTAALVPKSSKTLHRPVRFSGFKSVRILCFAVKF